MKYPTRGISKYRLSKQLAVCNKTIHGHIYVNNLAFRQEVVVADSYYSRNLRHY